MNNFYIIRLRKIRYVISLFMFLGQAFSGISQSYDQLKTQLQFENYYGTRLRSTAPNTGISGSECLTDDWLPIEITLPGGTIQFEKGRLNLLNSCVEVIYKDNEMFISPEHFTTLKISNQNRWFVSGTKYYYKDISLDGLLEIFQVSPRPPYIMEQHFVYLKEPNSNGYINGGSLEKKLIKSSKIFLNDGKKLMQVKNKNDLEKYYKLNKSKILLTKYIKELKVNFKDPRSVHGLVSAIEADVKKTIN